MTPAPVALALPKVFLQCLSCLFQGKAGVGGVVVQRGVGRGSGCAAAQAEEGRRMAGAEL